MSVFDLACSFVVYVMALGIAFPGDVDRTHSRLHFFHWHLITLREKFPVSDNVGSARMFGMRRASSAMQGI